MQAVRVWLCVCVVVLSVSAQNTTVGGVTKDCGPGGRLLAGCCRCLTGWAKDTAGKCSVCAEGYFGSDHGVCTDGRDGSPCHDSDGLPYPMGCGKHGRCTQRGGESVFPCVQCGNGMSPKTGCRQRASCMPTGPTIYTPFPNRPTADKDFNMIVVGCELDAYEDFAIVPARRLGQDAVPATCGDVSDSTFDDECTFNATDARPALQCSAGFRIQGGVTERHYNQRAASVTRIALTGIHMTREYLSAFEQAQEYNPSLTNGLFMLCTRSKRVNKKGVEEPVWRAVAGHNEDVSQRDFIFAVDPVLHLRGSATADDGEGSDDCCNGLKLGGACLPLWALLLLWLLMLGICIALGYTMVKTRGDLEQARNNRKYEQFCADADMIDLDDDQEMDHL